MAYDKSVPHSFTKSGIYYFERRVPSDLQRHYQAKKSRTHCEFGQHLRLLPGLLEQPNSWMSIGITCGSKSVVFRANTF